LLSFAVTALICDAVAAGRVALVIGNSDYEHTADLLNPENDASDLAAVLKRLDFKVTKVSNQSYDSMRRNLRAFARAASASDIALVFFAGHGLEVNKHNYLIPTDAELRSDGDIEYEALPLDLIINSVNGARHLGLVLVDACRNNPFAASMSRVSTTRSIGRGLARVEPAAGTLVSYAAKEGTVADDGDGRNSPYTAALVSLLDKPGLEINFLFRKVRDSVLESTNGRQEPFTYGSLPGRKIFLKPVATKPAATAPAETPLRQGYSAEREDLFWRGVERSDDPNMFEAYLERYPEGYYAPIARFRLAKLRAMSPAPQEPVTEEPVQQQVETPDAAPEEADSSQPEPLELATTEPRSDETVPVEAASSEPEAMEVASSDYEPYVNDEDTVAKCNELAADPDDATRLFGIGVKLRFLKQQARPAISACQSAVSTDPTDVGLEYQLGRAVFAGGEDYSKALNLVLNAADKGHTAAMVLLGWMYGNGEGVVRDEAAAVRWLRRAADRGDPNGIAELGAAYHIGSGVRRDYKEAMRLFREAAEKGNAKAMAGLSSIYLGGLGVRADHAEALRWASRAAEHGVGMGMALVGNAYAYGLGVRKDLSEAVRWYRRAANEGGERSVCAMATVNALGNDMVFGAFTTTEAVDLTVSALKMPSCTHLVSRLIGRINAKSSSFQSELQRALREEGVYTGPIDGTFGRASKRAIRELANRT
jgi:TPR repeat protein